jgi:hypothetical protein
MARRPRATGSVSTPIAPSRNERIIGNHPRHPRQSSSSSLPAPAARLHVRRTRHTVPYATVEEGYVPISAAATIG